jgi:hypothetical protein
MSRALSGDQSLRHVAQNNAGESNRDRTGRGRFDDFKEQLGQLIHEVVLSAEQKENGEKEKE